MMLNLSARGGRVHITAPLHRRGLEEPRVAADQADITGLETVTLNVTKAAAWPSDAWRRASGEYPTFWMLRRHRREQDSYQPNPRAARAV